MIYAIFILLVLCEVTWDWYHITKLNQSPNYKGSNIIRVLVGGAFWACIPLVTKELSAEQWWFVPVPMFFGFWFLFDWWLNVFRGRSYWYLGSNRLDQWQRNNGGSFAWFWIKGLVALFSVIVLEVII